MPRDNSFAIPWSPIHDYSFSDHTLFNRSFAPKPLTLTIEGARIVSNKTGKKPIVIRKSAIQFTEHDDKDAAIAEASRLATKEQDEFVVYVPVAIVRPKADVVIEDVK